MKKIFIYSLASMFAACLFSCADESMFTSSDSEGKLYLSASINSDIKLASRGIVEGEEKEALENSCIVWISNSKGVVRQYKGLSTLPTSGISLLADSYIAEAWAGDSVSASWEKKWFKGSESFTVNGGQSNRVTVNCKIANTLVKVYYDSSVDDVLTDYKMTVGHTRGSLTFTGKSDSTAYFMLPSGVTTLSYKLQGTSIADGQTYTREGTIDDVKQAYQYNLKVSCSPSDRGTGGLYFKIDVDPTEQDIYDEKDILIAPQIEGYNFDITKPVVGAHGNFEHRTVYVKSGTTLKNVLVECADFNSELGFSDLDLIIGGDEYKDKLTQMGVSFSYVEADDKSSWLKIRFEKGFINNLENGTHTIIFKATDEQNKTSQATLTINVTDAKIEILDCTYLDVWTFDATLRGKILSENVETVKLQYRVQNTADWTDIDITQPVYTKDSEISVKINDLQPATIYEWQMVADEYTSDRKTFTTGTANQLPNSSFENFNGSKPMVFYEEGGKMFWDSGNHGSKTAGVDVTVTVTNPVKDGNYAISLNSQKAGVKIGATTIGKFAAGNIFTGKYLKTDGTDGIIGFGREFTGRPKQLKVWAHYTPKNIDNKTNDAPAEYVQGQPDKGIIYIALMDNNLESYSGEDYPIVVQTKTANRRLFDPVGSDKQHVVAYGEHVFDSATSGTELVEVTVDLDYKSYGYPNQDILPSYIIITASASKGGDYFTGGDGSTLIIDDIRLVY